MNREPLTSVEDALRHILDAAAAREHEIEMIPVEDGDNRVLARDLQAKRTQPPFALSAMDGYALRAADTEPPGRALRLVGESAAGHPFAGVVNAGEVARIFTGAVLPEGADAVLIQERAIARDGMVTPEIALQPGTFIRRAGRDFSTGETHLRAGTRLDPGGIALAGAMGHAEILVFRRPRIAVLATGDELVKPGETGNPDSIVATNSYAIAALCRRGGAEILDLGIAKDNEPSLKAAFARALAWPADCLITIGGASVGAHDLVRHVAAKLGARLGFYKLAMRPGKPLNFGSLSAAASALGEARPQAQTRARAYARDSAEIESSISAARNNDTLLIGLPGNPVSSLVCARLFVSPLVAALQGDAAAGRDESEPAILDSDLKPNDERQDYLRASLSRDASGALLASPLPDQDSSLLGIYARAEALIIRLPHAPAARAGEACRLIRLRGQTTKF